MLLFTKKNEQHSLKLGLVIFWWCFPPTRPKELLREEKSGDSPMLATIRDDAWNVLNM